MEQAKSELGTLTYKGIRCVPTPKFSCMTYPFPFSIYQMCVATTSPFSLPKALQRKGKNAATRKLISSGSSEVNTWNFEESHNIPQQAK